MKPRILLFALLCCVLTTIAQLPRKFNYQAVVRNNSGTIVANQDVTIRFRIRDGSANGTIQYQETHAVTSNTFGLINLQVGGGTVVSGTWNNITWSAGNKYLQVEADITGGSNFISLAAVELIAVPYAVQAEAAQQFSGSLTGDITGVQDATVIAPNAVTNTKIADNAVSTAKIANGAVTNEKIANNAINTNKIEDGAVTNIKISDNTITAAKILNGAVTTNKIANNAVNTVKIADSAVTAAKIASGTLVRSINGIKEDVTLQAGTGASLQVSGNTITINGNTGDLTSVTAGAGLTGGGSSGAVTVSANFGGNGNANSVSRSDHTHVGQTWSTNNGYMLRLYDYDAVSTPVYINSYATSFSSAGISSQILSTTGQSVGVFGNTLSSDGNAAGVLGQAYTSGGAKAVWGLAFGANTFGIFGQAVGSGSWAGFFQGRVHVNGTLSKAAGSFKIDHPLDPANKYLSHSFVESPDMMNIYNGNVVLDANGEADVTLPDYFEALNKDFRYQLTAIGKAAPGLYIAEEINGNRFRIAGGAPGGKVSWAATGIRNDRYARDNRIPVVENKPADERGTLLYDPSNARRSAPPARGEVVPEREK